MENNGRPMIRTKKNTAFPNLKIFSIQNVMLLLICPLRSS